MYESRAQWSLNVSGNNASQAWAILSSVLEPFFNSLYVLGRVDIFGHRAADAMDCASHLASNFFVRSNSLLLVPNPLPCEFVAGLCHAKLISGQFSRVHPIHQILAGG